VSALHPQSPAPQTLPVCCVQSLLQPPQFFASVVTSSSQPSSAPAVGRLQFARPGVQLDVQAPALQARPATLSPAQARVQAPHWRGSPVTSCSHPSLRLVLQSP
jgi:hypothetical protein